MKKRGLLQHALAGTIASMGHTDLLVVADAGLPVPPGVACIDLAVRCGLPSMLDVTRAVADELQVEEAIIADELLARDEVLPVTLQELFPDARFRSVSHDELKRLIRIPGVSYRNGTTDDACPAFERRGIASALPGGGGSGGA
jgi:D-ribose pyranase